MPPSQPSHVRKRDGRLVPFDTGKLARSIMAAARECGVSEGFYAREIADAVALFLSKKYNALPPDTTEIYHAVEKILSDTRHTQVCYAYRTYRLEREKNRTQCKVMKPVQPSLLNADVSVHVTYNHEQRTMLWDRTYIIRALEREAGISHAVAEEISRSVEEKILSSGLSRVTTTLIRALTDNELLVRGYSNLLRQRSSVTLPFRDLEQLLITENGHALAEKLGAQAVPSFTLTHVYSDDIAMAHRRGLIHIAGLQHPFSLYLEHFNAFDDVYSQRQQRLLCADMLKRLDTFQLSRATVRFNRNSTINRLCGRIIELVDNASTLTHAGRIIFQFPVLDAYTILHLFSSVEPAQPVVLMFIGECDDYGELIHTLSELYNLGWAVGWEPDPVSVTLTQLISINLPQAVYRSRQNDLDGVIEELYRTVDITIQAHRQYHMFANAYNHVLTGRHAVLVDIIGLEEAVSILTGAGIFERNDNDACERVLLRVLHEKLHQAGSMYNLSVLLGIGEPNRCGKRFATIDQGLFPELFGFLPLHPSSLEHVIPAYRATTITCSETDNPEERADMAGVIRRYFDCGSLPVQADTGREDVMASFIQHRIGFNCCPAHGKLDEPVHGGHATPALPGIR